MLRKTRLSFLIASLILFATGALARVSVTSDGDKRIYQFQIDDVKFEEVKLNKNLYSKANLVGVNGYESVLGTIGEPEIPAVSFFVMAESVNDVQVIIDRSAKRAMRAVPRAIAPAQESLPKIRGAKINFRQNNAVYKMATLLPLKNFVIEDAGSIRGRKQKLITVYPFKYNPQSGQYSLDANFKVEVKESVVRVNQGSETFAFVVGEKYLDNQALKGYMRLKEQLGFTVKTIVVNKKMTPLDIRNELQAIYHNPSYDLKYALLVGDIEDVPSARAMSLSSNKYVTDHYYRAIDTNNYSDDVNGPDIGVGRITVKTNDELDGVIAKFSRYTMGDFERTDWFGHASFLATDDKYEVAEGSHNYAIDNFFAPNGYTGSFPDEVQPGGDKLYSITYNASDKKVMDKIRQGRFIINYSGHGATTYWDAPYINQKNVKSLTDESVLPFVISNACITGQFIISESYAETWLKHPAGAIFYWGSMDSSYWDEDDILERDMYQGIFDNGNRTFDSITQHALKGVWKHYSGANRSRYYWETYHSFGDPSIELRMHAPKGVNIDMPEIIPYGALETRIVVTDDEGLPVQGIRVSIVHMEGTASAATYTDRDGQALLSVPVTGVDVGDHYRVTVYGRDFETTTRDMSVASADFPFFVIDKFTINGEENLVATNNEELEIGIRLSNIASVSSTGGTVEIVGFDKNVKVINGMIPVPALAGEETVILGGLTVKTGDFLNEGEFSITFRWTNNEGQSQNFVKTISIERGILQISGVDFGDPVNPLYGGIKPNHAGKVWATFTNSGSRNLKNVNISPVALSDDFEIEGSLHLDFLAPRQSIRVDMPLNVLLKTGAKNDEIKKFKLIGTHDGTYDTENVEANADFVVGQLEQKLAEFFDVNSKINDNSTLVLKFTGLDGVVSIKDIGVHVKIKHSYVGDLAITLVHPSGKRIVLRKYVGGGYNDIDKVYGLGGDDVDEIDNLDGLSSDGEWKLEIHDRSNGDTGLLEYFKVKLVGYI